VTGEVAFLVLLHLAGGGFALAGRLPSALACVLGIPLGLAAWTGIAGVAASLDVAPGPLLTLVPAALLACVGLALAVRAGPRSVLALALSAVALAALAIVGHGAVVPASGHDVLLAARMPPASWGAIDPAARFLVLLHAAMRALGDPLATAVGPLAGAVTVALVAAGSARRPSTAVLAALALLAMHVFVRRAITVDVAMTGSMFLTGFAVVHARAVEEGNGRLLPIECLLLAGLAVQAPVFAWLTALVLPLAFARDPRAPARIAAWLGVLAAVAAWWYLIALAGAPGRVDLALTALAPFAAAVMTVVIRGGGHRRRVIVGWTLLIVAAALAGAPDLVEPARAAVGLGLPAGLLVLLAVAGAMLSPPPPAGASLAALCAVSAVAAQLAVGGPGEAPALFTSVPLLALYLGARAAPGRPVAPRSAAAMPTAPRAAAALFAGAMAVVLLTNLGQHARQHRLRAPGARFIDPGPTRRIDPWSDLHAWIRRRTPGVSAIIPSRLASQVVLFRYFDGIEVRLADPAPTIPAMAALELTMQADAYRTLQFKSRRAREWVVAFADPGSRRYILAESMFGVTYWLPEELYRAVGGEPRP
jgi:hypothetical protein